MISGIFDGSDSKFGTVSLPDRPSATLVTSSRRAVIPVFPKVSWRQLTILAAVPAMSVGSGGFFGVGNPENLFTDIMGSKTSRHCGASPTVNGGGGGGGGGFDCARWSLGCGRGGGGGGGGATLSHDCRASTALNCCRRDKPVSLVKFASADVPVGRATMARGEPGTVCGEGSSRRGRWAGSGPSGVRWLRGDAFVSECRFSADDEVRYRRWHDVRCFRRSLCFFPFLFFGRGV